MADSSSSLDADKLFRGCQVCARHKSVVNGNCILAGVGQERMELQVMVRWETEPFPPPSEPLTENDISLRCRFDVDCRLPPTGIDVRQNPGATSSSSHSMPAESENPIYPGGHRHVGLQSSVQLSGLLMSRHIDRTSWTADFTLSQ